LIEFLGVEGSPIFFFDFPFASKFDDYNSHGILFQTGLHPEEIGENDLQVSPVSLQA
jgi:hypothetical protein